MPADPTTRDFAAQEFRYAEANSDSTIKTAYPFATDGEFESLLVIENNAGSLSALRQAVYGLPGERVTFRALNQVYIAGQTITMPDGRLCYLEEAQPFVGSGQRYTECVGVVHP